MLVAEINGSLSDRYMPSPERQPHGYAVLKDGRTVVISHDMSNMPPWDDIDHVFPGTF